MVKASAQVLQSQMQNFMMVKLMVLIKNPNCERLKAGIWGVWYVLMWKFDACVSHAVVSRQD